MSGREPLWYCHECRAEMRPLMMPDPHCASCNGTFVEKMENPSDDPRAFTNAAGNIEDPFGGDPVFSGLQDFLRAMGPPPRTSSAGPINGPLNTSGGFTIRVDRTGGPGGATRTSFTSRPNRSGDIPFLSDYTSPPGRQNGDNINGALMIQHLLSMLHQPGRQGPMPDFLEGMMPPGAENGRMGDYVFNQEALDQIITQIMESSGSHPAPATDEIVQKLPREVLEQGSPLLDKDCAVCKEQFQLNTEDPDEQIVVTLPCKHPFHETCILPWLKSSGTCPVCRFQLVPQPDHHTQGPGSTSGSSGNGPRFPGSPGSPGPPGANPQGILGSLVNLLGGGSGNSNSSNQSGQRQNGATGNTTTGRSRQQSSDHFPGGWNEVD